MSDDDNKPPSKAIAVIHRESIIDLLSQGRKLTEIAPALGVSPNAISKVLKTDPEYRDAIAAGFHHRLDAAERDIERAAEQVDVARARAMAAFIGWRAERECPEVWGQRTVGIGTGAGVTINLQFAAPQHGVDITPSVAISGDGDV